jgi:hypothetical protein
LKHELDTSEAVQKDFVRLSQDLQIQLEKIRQGENEVKKEKKIKIKLTILIIFFNKKQNFEAQKL